MRLVLASGSPRRADLLAQIGLEFLVRAADVDETPLPGEAPEPYVVRLACSKARAVFAATSDQGERLVLGADTAVVQDGALLGKPLDEDDAVRLVLTLAGREHRVLTGIAVCGEAGLRSRCVTSVVQFRGIEPWEARAYARTGEGRDKAGGYGIQGIGGIFADSIRGSFSAVVGLPLAETEALLRESGLDTWRERIVGGTP